MAIDQKTIEHLAHLARLDQQNTREITSLQDDLNHIMKMIDEILVANTNDVAPMDHPFEATQALRQDRVTESNQREALLALSPSSIAGLFLVPQILE